MECLEHAHTFCVHVSLSPSLSLTGDQGDPLLRSEREIKSERQKERERVRKRQREREIKRERGRERERVRKRAERERKRDVQNSYFYFKRKDGCLGTF